MLDLAWTALLGLIFVFEDYSGNQTALMGAIWALSLGIGGLTFGYLSDTHGRIISLKLSFLYNFTGGLCFMLSPSFAI